MEGGKGYKGGVVRGRGGGGGYEGGEESILQAKSNSFSRSAWCPSLTGAIRKKERENERTSPVQGQNNNKMTRSLFRLPDKAELGVRGESMGTAAV